MSEIGRRVAWDKLTKTEWKVACLISRGLTDQEISEYTFHSISTTKTHVKSILHKLELRNRVQLAVWYTEERIAGRVPNQLSVFVRGQLK